MDVSPKSGLVLNPFRLSYAVANAKNRLIFWSVAKVSSYQPSLGFSHGQTRKSTTRPSGLEVEAAGDTVDVEALASEVETGHEAALHGFEMDLFEADAAAGDELVFVGGLALYAVATFDQFMNEGGLFVFGQLRPFGVFGDADGFDEALP